MGRTNEALWEKSKAKAKAKMGGKHSARAMQLAGRLYKKAGGRYTGKKTKGQKSMSKWTKEDWGTKSGKNSTVGPKATGERYLPKKARDSLSSEEYARTSAKKRADTAKGKQFSSQPKDIKKKTKPFRAAEGGVVTCPKCKGAGCSHCGGKGKHKYSEGGDVAPKRLKEVPASNPGLKRLPPKVRNRMGYMNKGGVVKANCGASVKPNRMSKR